jgi:hypothetical protein
VKKTIKGIISFILIICILSGSIITTFAAPTEVYLSDLRLVYADSYDEAKLILADTKLEGYKVLKENLNSNSGEKGVWLAYRTTLNVDDAITDIAVMQMNGGYCEGNYQEMIKKSRFEYLRMGKTYLAAIRYFTKACKAGSFLAQSAFRQLNFYTGLDDYKTERLGDIIVSGTLTESDIATFFLQGNTYVLKNVRSLISMGVSYNKDGMTYFENSLGGKVIVMGMTVKGNGSKALFNRRRKTLFQNLISRLHDDFCFVEKAADVYVIENEARDKTDFKRMLTLINMCADKLEEISLHIPKTI